jgi:hypothetical protein
MCLGPIFGLSGQICVPVCDEPSTCNGGSGETCMAMGTAGGFCNKNCTPPEATECSSGDACIPVESASDWFCFQAGSGIEGDACSEHLDCDAGLLCEDIGSGSQCVRICDNGGGSTGCVSAQTCTTLSSPLAGQTISVCDPAGDNAVIDLTVQDQDFVHVDWVGQGISCGPTCTNPYLLNTPVNLTAVADHPAFAFDQWIGGPCDGSSDPNCSFFATVDVSIEASFRMVSNLAFVTSTVTNGAMGGVSGANTICQTRADAANLPGTWVAMVFDGFSQSNLAAILPNGANGWYRIDGRPWLDTVASYDGGGVVYYPMRVDEFGNDVPFGAAGEVWTGFGGQDCSGWFSPQPGAMGRLSHFHHEAYQIDSGVNGNCNEEHRLICMMTDIDGMAVPQPPPASNPVAFVTSSPWVPSPGSGLGFLDAVCASEATTAGLSGTFLAYVNTETASAASRFTRSEPYYRVDGVQLAPTPGDFLNNTTNAWATVYGDAGGQYAPREVWTGRNTGNGSEHCDSWTSDSNLVQGIVGAAGTPNWQDFAPVNCDQGRYLYCLEN